MIDDIYNFYWSTGLNVCYLQFAFNSASMPSHMCVASEQETKLPPLTFYDRKFCQLARSHSTTRSIAQCACIRSKFLTPFHKRVEVQKRMHVLMLSPFKWNCFDARQTRAPFAGVVHLNLNTFAHKRSDKQECNKRRTDDTILNGTTMQKHCQLIAYQFGLFFSTVFSMQISAPDK